jgi:hypothetical protein
MLRSLKTLEGFTVSASDGDIGSVANFLIDDEHWALRYLVLDTTGRFDGRQVLISPISFRAIDGAPRRVHLALTKDKVNNSPTANTDRPVSRQHERDYYRYYGYAPYWGYSGLWGMGDYPGLLATEMWHETPAEYSSKSGDAHLRSASEVRGYHVQGLDDTIGHIEDFIVDDETWAVRYLVIDTSNWWFGKKVLIEPRWASRISWEDMKVFIDLSREAIRNSPEWDATAAINREYEASLHNHYGRPLYWDSVVSSAELPAQHDSASHPT